MFDHSNTVTEPSPRTYRAAAILVARYGSRSSKIPILDIRPLMAANVRSQQHEGRCPKARLIEARVLAVFKTHSATLLTCDDLAAARVLGTYST
jgi:hypothetical protein